MPYDINAIRKSIQNNSKRDPDEFRPATATSKNLEYRFFVLPPLQEGDVIKAGRVSKSMETFFIRYGQHWINDRPHSCPRIWDGTQCPVCDIGFKLHKDCKERNLGDVAKQAINKQWMPSESWVVNIFFTHSKANPEDLRGTTKYYRAPKSVYAKWEETILRDDLGDKEKPEAFGIFFDENAAFLFNLIAAKGSGKYNEYKSSSFIANNGIAIPMIANADKKADRAAIKELLASRINLWDKLEQPDPDKLKRLASQMMDGDDADAGFDEDENTHRSVSSTVESKTKSTPVIDEEEIRPKSQIVTDDDEDESTSTKSSSEDDDDNDIDRLLGQLED